MSKEMNVFNPAGQLSAEIASIFDVGALAGDLSDGASTGGFQTISIRGSKWRVKSGGEEHNILNEDGTMARMDALEVFAEKHDLKIHMHIGQGDREMLQMKNRYGVRPVAFLESIGYLDAQLIAVQLGSGEHGQVGLPIPVIGWCDCLRHLRRFQDVQHGDRASGTAPR